jgi:predicted transcriptional regulator
MSGRELEEKIRRILEKLFKDRRIVEKRMKKLKEFMRKKIEDFEREKYEKNLPYVRRFDYGWYIGSLKYYILRRKSLMTLILSTPHRRTDVSIKLLKKFFVIEEYDSYSSDVILIELPYNTSVIKPEFVNDHRVEEVIKEDLLRELEKMRDEIDMNDEQKQYFEKAVHIIKYLVTLKEILSSP